MVLVVHSEAHEPDEVPFVLDHQRHGGADRIVAITAEKQVYLVVCEQRLVDPRHRRGVGLVIDADQLDLTTEKATPRVDVLQPDLMRQSSSLSVRPERTGEREAVSNSDWFAFHRGSKRLQATGRWSVHKDGIEITDDPELSKND